MAEPSAPGLLTVGWREWLALPELGIAAIKAKVDTGARSSALHVDACESFERDGISLVRFSIHPGDREDPEAFACEAAVCDRRPVTDSGGHTTERIFIRTLVVVGALRFALEVNLSDRRNMLFPMLLGRSAMAGRLLVDPQASFLLGRPKRRRADGALRIGRPT
ncbi:MAG TPA: RimK/LysX family protein [Xanthomonadaceae bacterium]|nr:RimK/LysX family protein [Xanthomonadaceae bacterium]